MAEDIFKPAGATKASKPDAGGGVIRNVPVFGIVKNNVDPTRSGRIQVYISDLGGDDPNNSDNWATLSYMPPFYGFVEPTAANTGEGDYVANPASYGMWYSAPDLETTVICIFINGDPNYGFYIGAAPKPEALQMVPAIGASENIKTNNSKESQSYGGASILPVTNINTNNASTSNDDNFLDLPKPVHSYQSSIFFKQGLIRDTIRGPISSSANRESPSRVGWGVSTPGRPIYAGGYTDATIGPAAKEGKDDNGLKIISRQGGHTIVMDDGDLIGRNNLVRIRSAAGHQITMSDDGQTLFIVHSNGQSYIELGKEGTIDMFSTNSVNIRTQGDLNLHADNDINIHAKKKLNIKAEDIYTFSEKSTSHRVGTDYKIETLGKYHLKVADIMALRSKGMASFHSQSTTYINGSIINLNTGEGPPPDAVAPLNDKPTTDTLFDDSRGYIAAPGKLLTITTRAPAHSPWAHANQGVDISVSPAANDNLPASPSAAASKALDSASTTSPASPLSAAGLATVPPVPSASSSLNPTTAGSMLGAVATNAASGPAAAAVAAGAGLVQTSSGPIAAIGQMAQNPTQLASSGILKPGSAALIDSLVKNGNPLKSALPDNVFTGKVGVDSLTTFVNNPSSQISSMVTNFQQAQTSLTNAGLVTGKETPTAMAGLVLAGTTAGLGPTLNTAKSAIMGTQLPGAGIPGVSSPVMTAMNSGKAAAGLAQSSTGGLGPIMTAIGSMGGLAALGKSNSRGVTAAAMAAIVSSLTPLPIRQGTNSRVLANEDMAKAEARANQMPNPMSQATDLLKLAGRLGGPEVGRVTNAVVGGINSVNKLLNAQTPAQTIGGVTSTIGSIGRIGAATGNKALAKSARQINAVVNTTNQVSRGINAIASATSLGGQIGGVARAASSIGSLGSVLGNKNLATNSRKIASAARNAQNIVNSANRLVTSKNINTTLGALGSIINNANRIKGTFRNASKASGVSMLPAGTLSVASVVNKSLGKLGIPKNPALASIITNAATSTINNIAFPKSLQSAAGLLPNSSFNAPGALNNLQTDISKTLGSLQSAGNNLTSSVLSNMPAGAASQLSTAIGSIGFGGAGSSPMPSLGENTFDDSSITSAIGGLLEDPRIPDPVYDEEPDPAGLAALESALNENTAIDGEFDRLEYMWSMVDVFKEEYLTLEASLPPGDPRVDAARQEYVDAVNQAMEFLNEIEKKINY